MNFNNKKFVEQNLNILKKINKKCVIKNREI